MKKFLLVVAVSLVLAFASARAESGNQRAKLAAQSRDGVTNIARTLTSENWVGHINEALAKAPAGSALGNAWSPSEPHWDKAANELLAAMMKAFDDLKSAPEALELLSRPYQSHLTEDEAAEVLALSAGERKDLDAYVDTVTLAVQLLQHHAGLKVGSQDYKDGLARLIKMAKLPEVTDAPKLKLSAKTLDDYHQSRTASVDFLLTAVDGQLQLYWFDHRAAITTIITKAATGAGNAK